MKTLTLLALSLIIAPALLLASHASHRECWRRLSIAAAVLLGAAGGIRYLIGG